MCFSSVACSHLSLLCGHASCHVSSLSIVIYLFPLYLYIPAYTCILQLSFFECVYVRECVRVLVCVCVFVSMRAYVLVLV